MTHDATQPASGEPSRWYAVYTWARHEKAVATHFTQRGVTHFLPLYQTVHNWNKRAARLSLPLFPGYVFVQTKSSDHARPLQVPGVVHYVGSKAANPIPDHEIEGLRRVLQSGSEVAPHPYLTRGDTVRILSGPFAGLCGVIERTKSGHRIIVSVNMIMRSVAVEVDGCDLIAEPSHPSGALARA